jgi:hypothetical protein
MGLVRLEAAADVTSAIYSFGRRRINSSCIQFVESRRI